MVTLYLRDFQDETTITINRKRTGSWMNCFRMRLNCIIAASRLMITFAPR